MNLQDERYSKSTLMRGTFILSGAVFSSKFLGLIFFIPLNAIVGSQGMALYLYAYTPYTIILSLATLGIPLAVSKFIAKYNALGDYLTGRRLLRSGIILMSITGLIAFSILYVLAPAITPFVVGEGSLEGNNSSDVIMVIRLISIALIVVPIMSLIRGYFQGHQSMGPTAVSQVLEQIFRILFALTGSAIIVYMFDSDSISTAVGFATFAPAMGALAGLIVLLWYWFKRKGHLDLQLQQSSNNSKLPFKTMYKELITYAVPFVAVGLAIPLYQLIDQFTINNTLMAQGVQQIEAEKIYANISGLSQKLVMIPVALATALSQTLVPAITNSFSSGKYQYMNKQITQAFQIVLFFTIPAAVGLSVLSYPIYGSLYGMEDLKLGGDILRWYAPTALLFASFMITSSVLQGINRQKFAVLSLLIGVIFKLSLNGLFLTISHKFGAIWATDIGYILSITLNIIIIRIYAQYKLKHIFKRVLLISVFSALMAIVVWVVTIPFRADVSLPESWLQSFYTMGIGVLVGVVCYLGLAFRFNVAKEVLGDCFSFSKRKKGNK